MIYAIFLCTQIGCSLLLPQDMIYDGPGTIADRCLQWTAVLNGELGTMRRSNYEYRCLSRHVDAWN